MAISGFAPPIVERWAVEGVGDDDKSTGTSREMSEEGETVYSKDEEFAISQQGTDDLYRQHDSGPKTRVLTDLYRRHELGV